MWRIRIHIRVRIRCPWQESDTAAYAEFLQAVERSARGDGSLLIASYDRRGLSQTGEGHYSPLGGYHEGSGMVLILDVARFKYPPHWVSARTLWEAMRSLDSDTGLPRGYLVLSVAAPAAPKARTCGWRGRNWRGKEWKRIFLEPPVTFGKTQSKSVN